MNEERILNISGNPKAEEFNRLYIIFISIIATMGGFMFGFELGVITGVIPFIQIQYSLEGFALGWVVAIFELGCMSGALLISMIADRIGRKKSLQLTALSFLITTLGIVLAKDTFDLALWRFFQGAGVGAASVLSPMYIAEIAPGKMRGKMVSLNQLMIILGILLASVVCFYFGDINKPENWRLMFGFAFIPSAAFIAMLFFIPESPRWLMKKKSRDAAERILKTIGNQEFVERELTGIENSIRLNSKQGTLMDLFDKRIAPVLFIGCGLAVLQQFCGSNNITAYLQVIFLKANINLEDGLLNAVFVGLVFFLFTILSIFLIDLVGRKKLLFIGTLFMSFFLFMLSWSFSNDLVDGRLVFFFVMGFIATYAFTLAPVTWVVLSEIFPNYIRVKALSLASALLWLSCFIVVLISPYLLKVSPSVNFIIFGFFNLIGTYFVWRYVPETKGKSLEEIENIILKKS
ncbi:sugar porter family MFS transporter [Pedobacter sp. Du54]|uniref:sugar porter family MFS transporter n=1 Tax=Pedobacter anseongensis TaxID=3133439 RepID=UPI0030AC811F